MCCAARAGSSVPAAERASRSPSARRTASASAPRVIRDNGTFSFSHAVPREARRGTRIVLDVTQYCDGVGTSRTVRLRIGRDHHGCGGPLSDAEIAYDITVFGGLGCAAGENAIGLFIDTRIEPDGWTCAHVDQRIAGHDFACTEIDRPGRRVVARSVREV